MPFPVDMEDISIDKLNLLFARSASLKYISPDILENVPEGSAETKPIEYPEDTT